MANKQTTTKKRPIFYVGKFKHTIGAAWTPPEIEALADDLLNWIEGSDAFWLNEFFTQRRITKKTIAKLKAESEYFSEIYSLAKDIQETKLVKLGLKSSNSMAIFALKNTAGWRDNPEIEDTSDNFILFDGFSIIEPMVKQSTNEPNTTELKEVNNG